MDLRERAAAILRRNDRGRYTVPTHGLYPFQWNWDSSLTALGLSHLDEERAWTEIETLLAHQWDDGMVPHIVFHAEDDGYFPGPEVWRTGRPVPTSGITQPPVAAYAVRRLLERSGDPAAAADRAAALLEPLHAWHEWFHRCRDPRRTGLVALIHPWESGRDNAVDWDRALARVPTDGVEPFRRRDLGHADAAHRRTDEEYRRFIALLQHFRGLGWDNTVLHDASPFRVVDPGVNAVLIRACADLAVVADRLDRPGLATRSRDLAERGLAALDSLWDERHRQYGCWDRVADEPVDSPSVGGLLPALAAIPPARAAALADRVHELSGRARYLVPSHDPAAAEHDPKRYWRGPVWLVVNHLISDGLRRAGHVDVADRLRADGVALIDRGGFAEYYDPATGEGCGGGDFSWTAAMVLELLADEPGSRPGHPAGGG